MELQAILPKLQKDYFIFEQDGRVRQPLLQIPSIRAYEYANPGVFFHYYLHLQNEYGSPRFYSVRQNEVARDGKFSVNYHPLRRVELIDLRPHALETLSWEVLIVKIFQKSKPQKGIPAFLRLQPRVEPWYPFVSDAKLCRFQDEDANGKFAATFSNIPDHHIKL